MATVRSLIVKISADIGQLQKEMKKAANVVKSASKNITDVGKSLTKNISLPIAGVGVMAVKTAADFESAMSDLQSTMGKAKNEMGSLEKKAREMGSKTSKSAKEAAEGMKYMALAGWDSNQIMKGIEPVLRLSEAGNLDLARASDLVTDSMSAYGLEVKDLGGFLDKVSKTSTKANANIDMIMETFVGVGGALKNLNMPLTESLTLIGGLANRGIKGSEAGNKLSSVLINLQGVSGQAAKGMAELGVKAFDSQGKFKGTTNVLLEMNKKFKGMTEEKKNKLLAMIGGKTQVDTLNALLDTVSKEFDQLSKDIDKSDGALSKMAKDMKDNLYGQIEILKSSLEELAIQFGQLILPYVKKFTEFIQNLATSLQNVSPEMKKIIIIFGAIGLVVPPLIVGFGILASSIGSIMTLFSSISGSGIATSFGALLAPIGALSAPIIAIVAAIAALVGGFAIIILKSQEVRNGIGNLISKFLELSSGVGDKLMTFFGEIGKIFVDTWSEIDAFVKPAVESLKTAFGSLVALFEENRQMFEGIGLIIATALALVVGIVVGAVKGIMAALAPLVGFVAAVIGSIIDTLRLVLAVITGDWGKIPEILSSLFENVKNIFVNAFFAIIGLIGGFIDGIIQTFVGLYNTLVGNSIIPDMVNAIIQWFQNLITSVTSFVSSFVSSVVSFFVGLGVSVVSTVVSFVSRIVSTFVSMQSKVVNVIKSMASKIVSGIISIGSKLFAAGQKIVQQLISGIKSKVSAVADAGKAIVDKIASFLPQSPAKTGKLKKLPQMGAKIVSQLSNGIFKSVPKLSSTMKKISNIIYNGFNFDKKAKKISISNVAKMLKNDIKKIAKAANESTKGSKTASKDFLVKFNEDVNEYLGKVNESIKSNIEELKSRAKSYANTFGIFEKVEKKLVSGELLKRNLQSQVSAFKNFKNEMNKLAPKVGKQSLVFQKFQELGVQSLSELQSLNRMSSKSLLEYMNLFNERSRIAQDFAIADIERERMEERVINDIVFNITGNRIGSEDDTKKIADQITKYLRIGGVM